MAMVLKGNYIFTQRGEPAFLVASNFVNYISLGDPSRREFYLEGRIEGQSFLISARLYSATGELACEIEDNVPTPRVPVRVLPLKPGGYEIQTPSGEVRLRVELDKSGKVCLLRGRLHNEAGELIAEGDGDDLRIYKGPAVLGKAGGALGIVIGAETGA